MSVVRDWRNRRLIRGLLWTCGQCGRHALVRRRKCAVCGGTLSDAPAAMPRTGTVLAATEAGVLLERLDQATGCRHAVVLEMGRMRLACLVADSDTRLIPRLKGETMRLAVRRLGHSPPGSQEVIAYRLKAALDLRTRGGLRESEKPAQA